MTKSPGTIPELLSRAAAMWPEQVAIIDARNAVSYARLFGLSSQCSAELAAFGVAAGDRVAILLPNGVAFVATHFGALGAGAISMPLDATTEIPQLVKVIECSQPIVLIIDQAQQARISSSPIAQLPWLHIVVVEYSEEKLGLKTLKLSDAGVPDARSRATAGRSCDVLMFTNGTSGIPKGVMLRHHNVLSVVESVDSFVGYTERDTELIALPLAHSFGLGQLYVCMSKGACACISADLLFSARMFNEARRLKATGFSCTPAMLALLLKFCPQFFEDCRSHLRYCIVNSAAVPPRAVNRIFELNPELRVFHYYGLTEASRTTFVGFHNAREKIASVGRPMRHAKIKITGEDGSELPFGTVGEIAIAGDAIFNGYWCDREAYDRVMKDGWFHSGDLGYLDPDGFLFLVGRRGDLINIDGSKFHPGEVEAVLKEIPGVLDAGVVAVPEESEIVGAKVIGIVVRENDSTLDEQMLRSACSRKLRSFKVPKAFVIAGGIPKFASGKIDRKGLQQLAETQSVHQATGKRPL